jgi:imidazolonepropionase-like amidohydrolase
MKKQLKSKNEKVKNVIAFSFFILNFSFLIASDPVPAPKQKKPIAIIGATIHPVSGAEISNGTILFDKGTITAIGLNVAIPANAERINATGKHVYPGLISAVSNLGLVEIPLGAPGTDDLGESGSINPNARAEVAVHPESELIPVARSAGFTIAGVAASGGMISGTAAAMMLDGWSWEDMLLKGGLGLVVQWPDVVYRPPQNPFSTQTKEDWLKNRDTQLKNLRDAFAQARAYRVAKQSESQKSIPYHDSDKRWESMIPVLEGKTPVWVLADDIAQIQAAITWAEQENVKLVIVGGQDSWRVASHLKAKNIPVIVAGTLSGPGQRWEAYSSAFSLPKKLADAGVAFCIAGSYGGDNAANTRHIRHHAAIASAYGLSKEDALKSITQYAAQILGIADRVGSLEVGKDATLILTNGDPLEWETTVDQVFIQGKNCDMRDRQKQLLEKYTEKYKQMKE